MRTYSPILAWMAAFALTLSSPTFLVAQYDWVSHVAVEPDSPTSADSIHISVRGGLPNPGFELNNVASEVDQGDIRIAVFYDMLDGYWEQILIEWEVETDLGQLEPGNYTGVASLFVLVLDSAEYTLFDTMAFEFSVSNADHRLAEGWNLISANRAPDEHTVPALFADLADSLVIMKNGTGQFYYPSFNFNNIRRWDPLEGYAVKMAGEGVLRILGTPIPPDTVIHLREGWNLIAYLPDDTLAAADGFRNIEDVLYLAKDGEGHFYWPARGYDDLILRPGKGYLVNVTEEVDFIWNAP